jgi:hypothetical protein
MVAPTGSAGVWRHDFIGDEKDGLDEWDRVAPTGLPGAFRLASGRALDFWNELAI